MGCSRWGARDYSQGVSQQGPPGAIDSTVMAIDTGRAAGAGGAVLPMLAVVLAAASFVCMDATIKTLAARFDAVQLTFLRFASGSLFAIALWLRFRTPLPSRPQWRWHVLRCALLLVSLVAYFHALTLLPLVEAVAVSYLAPILISVLAVLILKERPSPSIWVALGFGAVGVAVSLAPELAAADTPGGRAHLEGLTAVTIAAFAFSGVMIVTRHQAQRDPLWTVLLVQNLLPLFVLALPAAVRWQPLAAADALPVLLAGATATVGLLAITWAFGRIDASRAAPLEYTGFVWAALLGYALFGEVPSATTLLSAALIVGGCLLLLRR